MVCTNKTMFMVPHRQPHREQLDNGYYLLKMPRTLWFWPPETFWGFFGIGFEVLAFGWLFCTVKWYLSEQFCS